MATYRVEFIRDWITGRWGFTDRVFSALKGKETEPSRLENAWIVRFTGKPDALGKMLSQKLNIQPGDFKRYGPIFEITQLDAGPVESKPTATKPTTAKPIAAKRLSQR